jgi:peptide/nickel transport system substrate-binding protein
MAVLAITLASAAAGCGGTTSSTATKATPAGDKTGGTVTVLADAPPDSVDPQVAASSQGLEAGYVVYTPLLTFAHANGSAGNQVIPGLATGMPTVSEGGKTYTLTLRSGQRYSNGEPMHASDFAFAIKRMLTLNWPLDTYFTQYVKGASDFLAHKATAISGITTDDATRQITIHLTQPYAWFNALLALPAAAPVPQNTPLKATHSTPPAGDGPFKLTSVIPNGGYTLVKNPDYVPVPGVPAAHVDKVVFTVNTNDTAAAEAVLSNQADVFDAANTVPPLLVQKVQSQAAGRFAAVSAAVTAYFFMNARVAPFNKLAARQAVLDAIDQRAFERFASGFLLPGCYLIPPAMVGHSTAPCPSHGPTAGPNLSRARQLVKQAGLEGAPVTVWGENVSPRRQYTDYMTQVLDSIGFKAQEKILAGSVYYTTLENKHTQAQMGLSNWGAFYPDPSQMFVPFESATLNASASSNGFNFGYVSDPRIDHAVAQLGGAAASDTTATGPQWSALDQYAVQQGYYAVIGYDEFPKFFSDRLDFAAGVFSPAFGIDDYTSLALH